MWFRNTLPYTKANRLADVLALVQVLAIHPYRHRSESGVQGDLLSYKPSSDWEAIALDHPEFFCVDPEARLGLSLIARHVLPKDDAGKRELPAGLLNTLIQAVIALRDHQVEQASRWRVIVLTSLLSGGWAILGIVIGKLL
jgi:hypothetical protein